jgi:hypothetical protein
MKIRAASLLVLAICLFCAAIPSMAQNDIYDNGPTNGSIDGWSINAGFITSDSFTISSSATVNGLNFAAWLFPGDILESAEVSITSRELGGTTYFDQTVNFTQSGCAINQNGFNVCTEAGAFSGPSLNGGTYWLNLQNAVTSLGLPVYWDENDGPSLASNNSVGTLPSESFTLLGTGSSTGSTPEPTSIVLFGSGFLGVCGLLRRRSL